jgi:rod shape-determining protein MreC
MHDKTIRRRRIALLVVVVASLLLLTVSFGGSGTGGGVGTMQRGVSTVLTPIQEGASRALKPVRDGIGLVGDTLDAKSQNKELKVQLGQARRTKALVNDVLANDKQLRGLVGLNARVQIQNMGLVSGRVIGRTPTVLNQQLKIDQGSGQGIKLGQPVLNGQGLVGTVSVVGLNFALVRMVTDASFGAGAKISESRVTGTVVPASGSPRELLMQYTQATDVVRPGQMVVTSGTSDPEFTSPFPPAVPIGQVTQVVDPGSDNQIIRVKPFVDVRDVDFVEVITKLGTSG